uniref:hypothetical protein n=1 Tax=Klebsiella pneumoniae TaxID=573 RepID=UPI001C8F6317
RPLRARARAETPLNLLNYTILHPFDLRSHSIPSQQFVLFRVNLTFPYYKGPNYEIAQCKVKLLTFFHETLYSLLILAAKNENESSPFYINFKEAYIRI